MDDSTPNPPPEKAPSAIPPGHVSFEMECVGIGPPLVVRTRKLLKMALRAYGLKCTRCTLPPDPPEPTHGDLVDGELMTGEGGK